MTAFVWTDRQVRSALRLELDDPAGAVRYRDVSTDSRTIGAGDLFVALRGENFDGHDHVPQAVSRGALGIVASRPVEAGDAQVYGVTDTLTALGNLARHRRRALPATVVGITGSVGKTTAKDLTRGALAPSMRVHATQGNLNNQIGVPQTLLAAPVDTEVVVVEMGTNEPGEIRTLTALAEPEIGVVTSVGDTHLEKLGSRQGVLLEKLDLLRGLRSGGRAVVGDEPPELPAAAREVISDLGVAGWSERADAGFRPLDARADDEGRYAFSWRGQRVVLGIPGHHVVVNALLALAVAELLHRDPASAARGIATVSPAAMRGEMRRLGTLTVLVDCYNANPQSVRAALAVLADLTATGGRVAVLGSMLELGERSDELHDEVLEDALGSGMDLIVATGAFAEAAERSPLAERARSAGRLVATLSVDEAYGAMADRLTAGSAVLLKGSRGVRLERLLEPLERAFGAAVGPAVRGAD